MTRAPFPDDRLGTALLPLRVAGTTDGQLRVLAAAEQVVVALRSAFVCDPQPRWMRAPVPVGEGRLTSSCDNLADVLHRTRGQCAQRHARLVAAADTGCAEPVTGLTVEHLRDGTVRALAGRGPDRSTPIGRLGDGELRCLAHALVLLTGPHVLVVDPVAEVPDAMQALTVLADGLDRDLDVRQTRALLALAASVCADGHMRLLGTVGEAAAGDGPGDGRSDGGRPGTVTDLDIAQLQRRLADFAASRAWEPYHTPKNLCAALSVEASELLEIFQWLTPEQSARVMEDEDTAFRVTDEVADVLAYLLQFCEVLGIDALAALSAKIERNETRFPVPDSTEPTGRHSSE